MTPELASALAALLTATAGLAYALAAYFRSAANQRQIDGVQQQVNGRLDALVQAERRAANAEGQLAQSGCKWTPPPPPPPADK